MQRTAALGLAVGLALISVATASSAQTKPIQDQLVGHWQLVSVDVSGNAPYGASPKGALFFDADGHYSVIVISDGGARNAAYFGTYTVDEADKAVTFHVAAGTKADAAGRSQKRRVTFDGDKLIQQSAPAPGRPVLTVTWKRD